MYRLIIVDDNKYELNGIKNSIDWKSLGIEVVGAFPNGAEVLRHVEALNPDIIITDIKMPKMNGIEMAEYIRQHYPAIKIIFISCHSDFEYAKSALNLGVYGYVLKPIISDELVNEVKKVLDEFSIKELREREKSGMLAQLEEMRPLVQEQFFRELLLGNYTDKEDICKRIDFLKIPIHKDSRVGVVTVKLGEAKDRAQNKNIADAYLTAYSIKNIISSAAGDVERIYPVQISEEEFSAILINGDALKFNSRELEQEGFINTAVNINNEITRRLTINAIMGVSKCPGELSDIPMLYRQSAQAVNTRFYTGSNPVILFEEIEDSIDIPFEDILDLEPVYGDIKAIITYGTRQEIRGFIAKYLDPERSKLNKSYIKSFTFLAVNIAGIILMESNLSFKDIFDDDMLVWKTLNQFDTITDVKEWIYTVFTTIKEYLAERNTTKDIKIVEMIKDIIKNRYHEHLSIDDISKLIYMSGRHANSLFKKETGKTIFDYLIEYRIENAKRLLKEPDSKVASVAEEVGYTNTSYFCLAFKKNVGITPAEYKSKAIL